MAMLKAFRQPAWPRWAAAALAVVALGAALAGGLARAQGGGLFQDADLALGERLISEHRCAACHQRKVGGNAARSTVPGPDRQCRAVAHDGREPQYRPRTCFRTK
jgi:hypothetical protein